MVSFFKNFDEFFGVFFILFREECVCKISGISLVCMFNLMNIVFDFCWKIIIYDNFGSIDI